MTNVVVVPRVPSTTSRGYFARTTKKGTLTRSPCARLRLNAGVSTSCSRTYNPTSTNTALAKKGTRQPQLCSCGSLKVLFNHRNTPVEHRNPSGAPSCGKQPYHACFPGGAFSVASSTAPPHSPPRPTPCPNLQSANRPAASAPMDE